MQINSNEGTGFESSKANITDSNNKERENQKGQFIMQKCVIILSLSILISAIILSASFLFSNTNSKSIVNKNKFTITALNNSNGVGGIVILDNDTGTIRTYLYSSGNGYKEIAVIDK